MQACGLCAPAKHDLAKHNRGAECLQSAERSSNGGKSNPRRTLNFHDGAAESMLGGLLYNPAVQTVL